MPGNVEFTLVSLAGNNVAVVSLDTCQTVAHLKLLVQQERPSANPRWQRLLLGGTLLRDTDKLDEIEGCSSGQTLVQFVLAIDPWDLVRDPEVAVQAASSLDALGPDAAPHIAKLFENSEGEKVEPSAAEDTLLRLVQNFAWQRRVGPWFNLRAAFLPYAMVLLQCEGLKQHKCPNSLGLIFDWLGESAVPRLASWLVLQERPLHADLRWRVEQLRRSDHPRVRVAAKSALGDKGGAHKARVQELVALRRVLARNRAALVRKEEILMLEDMQEQALELLQRMEEQAMEPHVKYAVSKALRRH